MYLNVDQTTVDLLIESLRLYDKRKDPLNKIEKKNKIDIEMYLSDLRKRQPESFKEG